MKRIIPDQRTWGVSRVARTLVSIAIVLERMGEEDMGDLTYNEAQAFHALTARAKRFALRMVPNPEVWQELGWEE